MPKAWRKHNLKLQRFEQQILPKKYKIVAGIDEAGRGPLAGPVIACAVVLRTKSFKNKICDSKKLSFPARQRAYEEIVEKAHIGLGIVNREIIDQRNILQATIVAMKKALDDLRIRPEYSLIDGRFRQEDLVRPSQIVVGGDNCCLSIACASIVAKVVRDSLMHYYAILYPQYGFDRNHGYCTNEHLIAIEKYGLTPIHRRSFRPICWVK